MYFMHAPIYTFCMSYIIELCKYTNRMKRLMHLKRLMHSWPSTSRMQESMCLSSHPRGRGPDLWQRAASTSGEQQVSERLLPAGLLLWLFQGGCQEERWWEVWEEGALWGGRLYVWLCVQGGNKVGDFTCSAFYNPWIWNLHKNLTSNIGVLITFIL